MSFVRILVLLFTVTLYARSVNAQTPAPANYKLIVNLDRAPFDSLFLQDYTEGRNVLIAGKKTKEYTWEITIPNYVVDNSQNMILLASPYDAEHNSKKMIRFVTHKLGKKVIFANGGVEENDNYIYGTYANTVVFPEEQLLLKVNNKDSVALGKLICIDFNLIIKDQHSDIAVRAQDPFFSWFVDANNEIISYDNYLSSYIQMARKYPGSRFLMNSLAVNLTRYKSKEDIRKVYDCFSAKHKNTFVAKHIEEFLSNKKFQNASLTTLNQTTKEEIIQDTSKYNLIIFTASWCTPCIEEIPLLKNIYQDLGKNLILTYISIDNDSGVASFKKLLQRKQIPWRSLLAFQEVENIKQRYFIEGIPHSILVHPNKAMEVIDVRKRSDRSKLYAIVKSFNNHN
ncbi:thioredoxin-like domain-containing protein [Mucilaginibacter sp. PAMB04168]|uniref:TlpA family protein disulfide reductase n=1 Tax=Mucilaginibacter sp. PAMB04168 TaxID=3138567 RepID=UPI0031F6BB7E